MGLSEPPDSTLSERDAALRFLYGRVDYERVQSFPYDSEELKLDRMRQLLHRLGNPQQDLQVVHVAGTKGKGSTSAMLAAILTAAGYRTGLFTSPHLEQIEERLAIDGRICSSAELVDLVRQVRPVVEAMDREGSGWPSANSPTFFEITTAMALLYFASRKTAVVVLEVGLGDAWIPPMSAGPGCRSSPASAWTTCGNWATRRKPSPGKRRESSSRACLWSAA